jgi:hypothetical protein
MSVFKHFYNLYPIIIQDDDVTSYSSLQDEYLNFEEIMEACPTNAFQVRMINTSDKSLKSFDKFLRMVKPKTIDVDASKEVLALMEGSTVVNLKLRGDVDGSEVPSQIENLACRSVTGNLSPQIHTFSPFWLNGVNLEHVKHLYLKKLDINEKIECPGLLSLRIENVVRYNKMSQQPIQVSGSVPCFSTENFPNLRFLNIAVRTEQGLTLTHDLDVLETNFVPETEHKIRKLRIFDMPKNVDKTEVFKQIPGLEILTVGLDGKFVRNTYGIKSLEEYSQ